MASIGGALPEVPEGRRGRDHEKNIVMPPQARTALSNGRLRPSTPKGLQLTHTRESSTSIDRDDVWTPTIYAQSQPSSGTQTPAGDDANWRQYAPPAVPTIPSQYWKGGELNLNVRPVYNGPADSAYAESSAAGSVMDLNRHSMTPSTPGIERNDGSDQVIRDFYKRMGGTPDIANMRARSESSSNMGADEPASAEMRVKASPPPPSTSLAAAHVGDYKMAQKNMEDLVSQVKVEPRYEPDTLLKEAGTRNIKQQKFMMTCFLISCK